VTDPDLAAHYKIVLDDVTVSVTNLFDEFGNAVHRWEDAARFVAGPLPDGTWMSDVTRDFVVRGGLN
jgi:hypothetical protein